MSDSEEKNITNMHIKHPPAMKVGGMRVPQPKFHHEKEISKEDENDKQDIELANQSNQNLGHIVSGVQIKDKEAFPTEAVKHCHEKSIPTSDKSVNQRAVPFHNIYQPRRNT